MDDETRQVLYLEELQIGPRRKWGDFLLTKDEIVEFARRWDPRPFHLDPIAAIDSVFGELVACGAHLFSITSLLFYQDERPPAILSGLSTTVTLESPGRPCDRLHLDVAYTETRPSSSRPDAGVVRQQMALTERSGRVLLRQDSAMLVRRRPQPA